MWICASADHDDLCVFDDKACPACKALRKLEDAEDELRDANDRIAELEERLEELQAAKMR